MLSYAAVIGLMAGAVTVRGADADAPTPKAEQVAPGIWRLHFGDPEQFTPTHFRSAAMDTAGLEAKASSADRKSVV